MFRRKKSKTLEEEKEKLNPGMRDLIDLLPQVQEIEEKLKVNEKSPITRMDIFSEMRDSGFKSSLAPRTEDNNVDDRVKNLENDVRELYLKHSREYLQAGIKQVELGFLNRAVIDLSLAILSTYIAEGVLRSTYLLRQLTPKMPTTAQDSYFFRGVKLLLKSIIGKNKDTFAKAKSLITHKESDLFYHEDKLLIEKVLDTAELELEGDVMSNLLKMSKNSSFTDLDK